MHTPLRCHHYTFHITSNVDMVARYWVSGESSLVVKSTLDPPVPALKAEYPVPITLLISFGHRGGLDLSLVVVYV